MGGARTVREHWKQTFIIFDSSFDQFLIAMSEIFIQDIGSDSRLCSRIDRIHCRLEDCRVTMKRLEVMPSSTVLRKMIDAWM